jgi:hypothetical protein
VKGFILTASEETGELLQDGEPVPHLTLDHTRFRVFITVERVPPDVLGQTLVFSTGFVPLEHEISVNIDLDGTCYLLSIEEFNEKFGGQNALAVLEDMYIAQMERDYRIKNALRKRSPRTID